MVRETNIADKKFVLHISREQIAARIEELAGSICAQYKDKTPHFIVVLNGAAVFAVDLIKALEMQLTVSFVRLSSYHGLASSGHVKTIIGLDDSFVGRPVIIVEDIIDTGKTLYDFLPEVWDKNPSSVNIATFLTKPGALKYAVAADYTAFEIENKFVVGYGLDYNELGRNLPDLYMLAE